MKLRKKIINISKELIFITEKKFQDKLCILVFALASIHYNDTILLNSNFH